MRDQESNSEWERKASSVSFMMEGLTNRISSDFATTTVQRASQMDALRIENQTRIFASMCPDEILDFYDNYNTRTYQTTLMLGDVSGFTEMTEKYTKSGKGGPSKLTETLNSYIGAMVQEILSHNGDVLKFSGDAFIVMWKLENGGVMRDIASEAIKTACIIQKHFGTYETDIDVTLKVKLAIASGKTYFTSIGDASTSSYYIITGKPVWDVKYAEALCRGGDILVASSCWQWVNPNEYIYEILPDGIHTLIISLSVLWETTKEQYGDDNMANISESSSDLNSIASDSPSGGPTSTSSFFYRASIADGQSETTTDYSLRPKVIKAARAKLNNELRSYMLRPVIRSVEMDEPLEYLTEIRQVVIVFVNVITEETNRKTLIKLVNATFSFVCSVVSEMQGCVNKTSLFDKDLIFLCIFGLRGDKHELESQIGLRCASKLRRGLVCFEKVKSVTVGVTTGMTYCGVVGHVLRREYTVIGMAVNKAARLMCAYVNKVVCDRESFLLSHLEAKHFILQKAKVLKGITNAGPVYEFSEQSMSYESELIINKYPILGRDEELHVFREMLGKMLEVHQCEEYTEGECEFSTKENILIIRAEPRMGKTRILEEMTNIAPSETPVNFISLAPNDNQLPYILLRLIFYAPLEITEASHFKEKQKKLSAFFKDKDQSSLCALNHVFNVNFKLSTEYTELMDHRERKRLLKKLIARLTRRCFDDVWVVIVDDAELADDESIGLMHTVAKQRRILFVLAYGNKLSKDYPIPQSMVNDAKMIDLDGLDKWFHAALACHVMGVIAIPADLEKVIQERSSGNPGWIESYLISLLQSTGIVLKNLTKTEIQNMGLVMPSRNMLERLPNELNIEFGGETSQDKRNSGWEMYQTSFKESSAENTDAETDEKVVYPVCVLTTNFILEDADTEATMDSILLKLYDSLTPLDQFLLKCAAVLGEIVDRKILEQLMQGIGQREIGLSLEKLFDLRIIGCAVGDFSRSPGPFKRVHDPNANIAVRCGCKGIEIPEVLADLPKYASCGLMRFKLDMFRETTYRLLTENQKVEFHSKALRYLQQSTRRCDACGGGQFNRLLGKSALNEVGRKKLVADSSSNEQASDTNVADDGGRSEVAKEEQSSTASSSLSMFRSCRPIQKSPTRTFSQFDFTDCECNLRLLTAYTHVLEHCRGIVCGSCMRQYGVRELLLVAILEFIEVCISTLNIPQAAKLLTEGDELIDLIYNSPEDALIILPYLKGKIQTLRGRCYLESGLITEAMACFEETLVIMRYTFPTNVLAIRMTTSCQLRRLQLTLTCLRRFRVGIVEGDAANYNDQFASCLAQMFIVYRLKGMQKHARLAAIWGLNVALESSKDFFVLCTAYANMMITAHVFQYKSMIPRLETDAINLCNQRQDTIELQELNAVAELYTRIFFSRWLRGMTEKATSIGFVAKRVSHAIRSINLKLIILPRLIQLLITQNRYGEVVSMLQELEFISQNDMDQSGQTWYYSLCVDLLLEAGISLVTLRECEQFYQQESSKILNLKDAEAAKRFFICMWLWYVRIGDWEAATVWRDRKIRECDDAIMDEYTVASAVTVLKKLEGLIICYVFKLDHKNIKDAPHILSDIKGTFKVIADLFKVVKTIQPRYLLMKAYYHMVKFRTKSSLSYLRKSKRSAEEIGNVMIYNWADHCKKAWTGQLSAIQQDFWREQCTMDKRVDWHEVDMKNRKILPYTLPLPKSR